MLLARALLYIALMLEAIDDKMLERVTGGISSSMSMMMLMAFMKKFKGGGFKLDDEGRKKIFDLFKGQFDKKSKPDEGGEKKKSDDGGDKK